MNRLVIVPTYNERENIGVLIENLQGLQTKFDVLIVDNNSTDGTGQFIFSQKASCRVNNRNIFLITQKKPGGLGNAYKQGFLWALDRKYDVVATMDSDGSHRPIDLEKLFLEIEGCDFVVGSRYIDGGDTQTWQWQRKWLSVIASGYVSCLLGFKFCDWTGGLNAWTSAALKKINFEEIHAQGFCFNILVRHRAERVQLSGKEVAISFKKRHFGCSKLSLIIILEALYVVFLAKHEWIGRR